MALDKITYDNKVSLNPQPSVANVNKCTDSDLNEIKNVVNAGIDTINGNGIMGDIVVDGIRTKNMFDKSTFVQGDIVDAFPTLRITSRQVIWLEVGTYTASTNLSSTYQWGIQIQNVGTLPLSSYPTYIYETGWQTVGTTEKTFTINTAGWYNLMIRRSDNGAFTNTDLTNIYSSNYQLEKGEEATTFTPYQSLNGFSIDYVKFAYASYSSSITINANAAQALPVTLPTIHGYKPIACVGGKGNGNTGLLIQQSLVSNGSFNTWVTNVCNDNRTYSSVDFLILYIRDL